MKKKQAHGRPRAVADVTPVLADYEAGMLVKDIAVKYGIGRETVRNYARRAGLGRRENGESPLDLGGNWVPNGHGTVVWVADPPTPAELARLKAERARRAKPKVTQPQPAPVIPPGVVIDAVCAHFGIAPYDIHLDRTRDRVTARRVAMWVLRRDNRSLTQVGEIFGKDHKTVLYNVRRVQADPDLLAVAHRIRVRLIQEAAA